VASDCLDVINQLRDEPNGRYAMILQEIEERAKSTA
jgi:hypothetical protein